MSADTVLMTVTSPGLKPDLKRAADILKVSLKSVDSNFGVVAVDPDKGIYAVQVAAEALPAQAQQSPKSFSGPFSNPRIEAFGPRRMGLGKK